MKHLPHSENNRTTLIWKSITIVFVSLLCSLSSSAQDIIFEHSYEPSEFSTIRNYTENVDIKYEIRIGPGYHKRFSYIDRSNGTVITFNINDYWSVSDFRILNGYVYFCGRDNGVAAFGWFNIDSVFFYNGDVHVMRLSSAVPNPIPSLPNMYIEYFDRLAISRINGIVHFYLIGYAQSTYYDGDVIADAWLSPSTGWHIEYSIEYEHDLDYQDLTLTSSDLVVVGTLTTSDNHYEQFIQYYTKQTSADADKSIFYNGFLPPHTINLNLYIVPHYIYEQRISTTITHVAGDSFVTVGENVEPGINIIVVSRFNTPTMPPVERFMFKDENRNRLREVTYNIESGVLGLAMWNTADYIHEISIASGAVFRVGVEKAQWCSISNIKKTGLFIISGSPRDFSKELIWQRTPLSINNCIYRNDVLTNRISPEMYVLNNIKYIESTDAEHNIYPVKDIISILTTICE